MSNVSGCHNALRTVTSRLVGLVKVNPDVRALLVRASGTLGAPMIESHRFISAAVVSALLGTSVASAADLPAGAYTKAPPVDPAPMSWSGCYLGGNVGAGWDRVNAGEVGFAGVPTPFLDYGSNTGSSLIGGGQIGCDYQFNSNWVVGLQGKAEFGDINSSNLVAAFPGITAAFKLKNTETLTARLGYTIAPTVLAYVKGGAAWSNVYAAATAVGVAGETADFRMMGYTVGGGLEWMFAPGWSVFGEYNYMDFGTKNVNFPSTGLLPGFGSAGALADTNAVRLKAQEAVVGVNYKFNWGGPAVAKY
jgi:outer membrane immunogenic protein